MMDTITHIYIFKSTSLREARLAGVFHILGGIHLNPLASGRLDLCSIAPTIYQTI